MASVRRATWKRIRKSVSEPVARVVGTAVEERDRALHLRLDALESQLATLNEQVRELREIAAAGVDAENQTSELFGRLLRSATSRIEALEEQAVRGR